MEQLAVAVQDTGQDRLAIDGVVHRLAHAQVVERRRSGVEGHHDQPPTLERQASVPPPCSSLSCATGKADDLHATGL